MANYIGNVKAVNLLQAPRGMNNGGVALVTFDLINQAQSGSGTDTIQLGGGGYHQGVATTRTLAQLIADELRDGGTCTLDAVMPFGLVGLQAGNALYAGGSPTISSGNVASIGMVTAAGGSSARSTTSATWDAAAGVVVAFHMSTAQ